MTETYWTKKQGQELYDKALELDSQGKTLEAVGVYQKLINASPKNAQALYNLGVDYATLGNIEQAIRVWRRAVWLDETFRDELIKAFSIDDDLAQTVIGGEDDYLYLGMAA